MELAGIGEYQKPGSGEKPPQGGLPDIAAGPLSRFYAKLAALKTGRRSEPVTILHIGDSHVAADSFTRGIRSRLQTRFGDAGRTVAWNMIREAMRSVAALAIFPLQDLLGLGSSARMNVPGVAAGNWAFRAPVLDELSGLIEPLSGLARLYGRHPHREEHG